MREGSGSGTVRNSEVIRKRRAQDDVLMGADTKIIWTYSNAGMQCCVKAFFCCL